MDVRQYIGPLEINAPVNYGEVHWSDQELVDFANFIESSSSAWQAMCDYFVENGQDDDCYEYQTTEQMLDLAMNTFLPPSYREGEPLSLSESIILEAQIPAELPGKVLNYVRTKHGARAIDIARAIGYGDQWRIVAAAVKQLAQAGDVNIVSHPNLGLFVFPKGMEAKLPGGKQVQVAPSKATPAQKPVQQTTTTQKPAQSLGFKNAKDEELGQKVIAALKSTPGLSQLAICQVIGFPTYDMRTTMVIRELTIRQMLTVDKSAKPMTFSLNPNYNSGTPRLQVATKPQGQSSPRSLKAKKELADKIRRDLDYMSPGAPYYDKEPATVEEHRGMISIYKEYRELGTWEHNEEDDYYHRKNGDYNWREDDDHKIWTDVRKFTKRIRDWVKTQDWRKAVKDAYAEDHAEKSWGRFTIDLK